MSYTVKSSERLRNSASEAETKALLYLMNFHEDSDDIYYFIVDFFNDLTGMDNVSQKLWDIQSKGASKSSPKAIGKELVTLFKNYCSDFEFNHYILFLGGVTSTLRKDSTKNIFDISNIKISAQSNLKTGLVEECNLKTYIDSKTINNDNINAFLEKVLFVVDDKKPSEYIKSIVKIHPGIIPDEKILIGIFNEIRDKQASKKNISSVEGLIIETSDEALNYYRHLTKGEIKLMVLGRIINRNPFEKGIPAPFVPIYNKFPADKQQEALEDCRLALSRALFNKNCADNFWNLFENVYNTIISNPSDDVQSIFRKLKSSILKGCPDFDVLSVKYFIASVKEGIQL